MLTRQFFELLKCDFINPFSVIDDGNENSIIGSNVSGSTAYTTLISDSSDRIIYNKKWTQRFKLYPSVNSATPSVDDYVIDRSDLEECDNTSVNFSYSNGKLTIQITGTFENPSAAEKTYNKCGVFTNVHYWDSGEQNNEVMIIEALFDEPLTLGTGESATINITESFEV